MRLIDADELIANLHTRAFKDGDDRSIALKVIEDTPTADNAEKTLGEIETLKEKLHEAILASEHNERLVKEERLRQELYRRDGMIEGLKYAIMCNGVSGSEIYEANRR